MFKLNKVVSFGLVYLLVLNSISAFGANCNPEKPMDALKTLVVDIEAFDRRIRDEGETDLVVAQQGLIHDLETLEGIDFEGVSPQDLLVRYRSLVDSFDQYLNQAGQRLLELGGVIDPRKLMTPEQKTVQGVNLRRYAYETLGMIPHDMIESALDVSVRFQILADEFGKQNERVLGMQKSLALIQERLQAMHERVLILVQLNRVQQEVSHSRDVRGVFIAEKKSRLKVLELRLKELEARIWGKIHRSVSKRTAVADALDKQRVAGGESSSDPYHMEKLPQSQRPRRVVDSQRRDRVHKPGSEETPKGPGVWERLWNRVKNPSKRIAEVEQEIVEVTQELRRVNEEYENLDRRLGQIDPLVRMEQRLLEAELMVLHAELRQINGELEKVKQPVAVARKSYSTAWKAFHAELDGLIARYETTLRLARKKNSPELLESIKNAQRTLDRLKKIRQFENSAINWEDEDIRRGFLKDITSLVREHRSFETLVEKVNYTNVNGAPRQARAEAPKSDSEETVGTQTRGFQWRNLIDIRFEDQVVSRRERAYGQALEQVQKQARDLEEQLNLAGQQLVKSALGTDAFNENLRLFMNIKYTLFELQNNFRRFSQQFLLADESQPHRVFYDYDDGKIVPIRLVRSDSQEGNGISRQWEDSVRRIHALYLKVSGIEDRLREEGVLEPETIRLLDRFVVRSFTPDTFQYIPDELNNVEIEDIMERSYVKNRTVLQNTFMAMIRYLDVRLYLKRTQFFGDLTPRMVSIALDPDAPMRNRAEIVELLQQKRYCLIALALLEGSDPRLTLDEFNAVLKRVVGDGDDTSMPRPGVDALVQLREGLMPIQPRLRESYVEAAYYGKTSSVDAIERAELNNEPLVEVRVKRKWTTVLVAVGKLFLLDFKGAFSEIFGGEQTVTDRVERRIEQRNAREAFETVLEGYQGQYSPKLFEPMRSSDPIPTQRR